jgi:hypothetical protein
MQEDLIGMSSEQLMLRDLIYEVPELLEAADQESREYQAGVFHALSLLRHKLEVFEIDQSRFARQLPDVEAWFLRGSR